jgi:hypothetical protein
MRMSRIGSIGLIVIGALFLMNNLGWLSFAHIGGVLRTWWPLILVVIGLLGLIGKK